MLLIELFGGETSPYVGFFHYLVLPPLGAIGLFLMALGWWLERLRKRAGLRREESRIALDIRRTQVQQRILMATGVGSAGLVFVMALGGQRAFVFSESVTFCGEVCHSVMEPEYVAHQRSPHAQVRCVDCHVGSGMRHYVAAKVRGMDQVIAVMTDSYERPIPIPVTSLRSSREICERCHWAGYDVGELHRTYTYYSSEGIKEVPWKLEMLLKVGHGDPAGGSIAGIHWHAQIANVVEYIARDEKRQDIPWVRLADFEGNVTIYRKVDDPPGAELEESGTVRAIECVDCHNRPAHRFVPPVELVNSAMLTGALDAEIPEIKLTALEVLAAEYESSEAAEAGIEAAVVGFYEDEYSDFYEQERDTIETAVAVLSELHRRHFFPVMKSRWSAYPDNSGHRYSAGCFRCHDGLHESDDGRVISASCDVCHSILSQGLEGSLAKGRGLAFEHPWNDEVIDEATLCHECHDGALSFTF